MAIILEDCPCGAGPYAACCGRYHHGEPAPTPEQLMRSRYAAMVLGLENYLFRTWHPRTRPRDLSIQPVPFTRLVIVDAPEPSEDRGEVAFEAHSAGGVMTERSRFEKRARKWFYVDGDLGGRPHD